MKTFVIAILIGFLSPWAMAKTISWGQPVAVGNGQVRSYIEMDDNNKPLALGIAMSGSALQGLPDVEHEYNYLLPMPQNILLPPYEHVMLNWNPHGHEPPEIYGVPHFDFHFYTITEAVRQKITCADADQAVCMKMPEPDYIPAFYAPTPAGVPMMGWHWYDTRSPEFNGKPFTSTLIYGFYNGEVAFVEPMVTRAFLLSKASFSVDIPLPAKVKKNGFYPAHYDVSYDSCQDLILVNLNRFTEL